MGEVSQVKEWDDDSECKRFGNIATDRTEKVLNKKMIQKARIVHLQDAQHKCEYAGMKIEEFFDQTPVFRD